MEKAVHHLGWVILLATGLLATTSLATTIAPFCTKVVSTLTSCPDIPTIDTVNLNSYTGRWFSVGTSAEFYFLQGRGGQCSGANYTALGVINGANTIKVVNRGRLFSSMVRETQSVVLSRGAGTSGLGVRLLCSLLVGTQSLSSLQPILDQSAALLNTSAPSLALIPGTTVPLSVASLTRALALAAAGSSALSRNEKASIARASANILGAVEAASKAGEVIFGALEDVQDANNVLSGLTLPTPYNTPKTVAGIQKQSALVSTSKDGIEANRDIILKNAATIMGIAQGKDKLVESLAKAIAVLAGPSGPLSLSSIAIGAGSTLMSVTAATVQPETVDPRPIGIEGIAVQNASQPGALTVGFFGPPTGPNNYKIIKLEGQASRGYSLAVVFSCSPSPLSAFLPQIAYFILSRTANIPQSVLDATLASAAKQGIFLGGNNAFLVTNQNRAVCAGVFP